MSPAARQKRGYSYAFPAVDGDRRIKLEIDKVPPSLDAKLRAKLARSGMSLRHLTLTLWTLWLDVPDDPEEETKA